MSTGDVGQLLKDSMVTNPSTEVVELRLANSGTELWAAIEAAQFARFMVHSKPISPTDRSAVAAFAETFANVVEVWEETPAEQRALTLESLTVDVRSLNEQGYFVHSACIERTVIDANGNNLTVPIAVVSIDQSCARVATVSLPAELDVGE